MKIGRNIPKTYMDRHFDTERLFNHSRPRTPKVVLPIKSKRIAFLERNNQGLFPR